LVILMGGRSWAKAREGERRRARRENMGLQFTGL
jgi:hypothetical protein